MKYPLLQEYTTSYSPVEEIPLAKIEQSDKNNSKSKAKKKENKKGVENSKKKAKTRDKDAHNAKVNKLVTVYKIQILASSDLLNQGNERFCGLDPIIAYKENNLYKYFYGESTDREEVENLLADVKKKIPDAFIVTSQKSVQSKKIIE